jgi:nucleoside-diphosphate-sugar epimerase
MATTWTCPKEKERKGNLFLPMPSQNKPMKRMHDFLRNYMGWKRLDYIAKSEAVGKAYNVACGESTSLLEVVKMIEEITGNPIEVQFAPPRQGDIKDSLADISLAKKMLGFYSLCDLKAGLAFTVQNEQLSVIR